MQMLELIGFLILGFITGILLYKLVATTLEYNKIRNIAKNKMKEVEEMKARGEHHKWMDMNVNGKVTHVCEKTGYAPELEGFVPMQYVVAEKEGARIREEYEKFRSQRLLEIANKYGVSVSDIEIMSDEIKNIDMEFTSNQFATVFKNLGFDVTSLTDEEGRLGISLKKNADEKEGNSETVH